MNGKKLNAIMVALLVLLGIGLLASVYFANNALTAKSKELISLRATKQAKEQQEAQLSKAKQDIKKYGDLNEIAKSVVPQDKDQAKTVGEIVNLANQSGIKRLSSISFPPSTLGAVTTPSAGSSSNTGASSSATKPAKNNLTQLTPVKGMPGVYQLPITISQTTSDAVSYGSLVNFLSKLEHNRRTALVSSINVTPDSKNPDQVSFTLVINEYIKP